MSDLAPRFEDVPVEIARDVARRERKEKTNAHARANVCRICGEEVQLEQCKIDEDGGPVHGDCYVKKVLV
jgi:hypothetical protein